MVAGKTDLLSIVRESVHLEPVGENHVGTCPFCQGVAKFHVIARQQFYHCFGCKTSGDVFSFIQRRDGITFHEALTVLANKAGVSVAERPDQQTPESYTNHERQIDDIVVRVTGAIQTAWGGQEKPEAVHDIERLMGELFRLRNALQNIEIDIADMPAPEATDQPSVTRRKACITMIIRTLERAHTGGVIPLVGRSDG